jgi:putative oxidoreductase
MNTTLAADAAATATATGLAGLLARLRALLERIPYSLLALIARGAAFEVFWRSGQVKLDDWAGTIHLFEEEYKVPLIPPGIAAQLAAGMELGGSVLLLAGLFSRGVALMFIGMVTVIQVFVYPEAWPTHIQWLAFLALLVARGPGIISLDALIARWLAGRGR